MLPRRILEELSDEELIPVVLHELAHVKRRDWLVNWAQLAAGLAFFFNPLLWFANRRIRSEREKACDDMVLLALGMRRKRYADSLLKVLDQIGRQPSLLPAFMGVIERRGNLAARRSAATYRAWPP